MNDPIGLRIIGALLAATSAATLMQLLVKPTTRLANRVRPYTLSSRSALGRTPDRLSLLWTDRALQGSVISRLYRPFLEAVAGAIYHLFGSAYGDQMLSLKLRQAGRMLEVPESDRVAEYRIHQIGSGMGMGLALGFGATILRAPPSFVFLLATAGVVLGVAKVSGGIDKTIQEHRQRIRIELYTVNQLLAMYLRTSGSPALASQRLVQRGRGLVFDELSEALRLHTRGMSASRAFSRMAEVTPEPFAARTYKLLASGSERGADLASALLSLSEDVRDERRAQLRRTATKRQAAMLIPIIGILAPIMMLFIIAPLPQIVLGAR